MKKLIVLSSFILGVMCACHQSPMYTQEQLDAAVDSATKAEQKRICELAGHYAGNLIDSDSLDAAEVIIMFQRYFYHPYPENFFAEGWIFDQKGDTARSLASVRRAHELYQKRIAKYPDVWGYAVNDAVCEYILKGKNRFVYLIDSVAKAHPDSAEYILRFREMNYEEQKDELLRGKRFTPEWPKDEY